MPQELGQPLIAIETVQEKILEQVQPVETESRSLAEAIGCVLRESVLSRELLPRFDNSAMDGFGVRSADIGDASTDRPISLSIAGVVAAGDAGERPLAAGTAVRIMTGAPVPPGVDAVVPHELTVFDDDRVTFNRAVRDGQNIRRAGEDFRPGDVGLHSGRLLRAPHMAIAATLGWSKLQVSRPLRVAILSPGDELVEVDQPCGPGKIRNSNSYSLRGAVEELGATVVYSEIIADDKRAIRNAISAAIDRGADALLSTGGVSAGDFDFVQEIVREEARPGFRFKVAMRPGKPQVFGLFDGVPLFGMPGNPAASIISFEILVRPALRRMRGEAEVYEPRFRVRFPFDFRYPSGRVFLLRARIVPDLESTAGGFVVESPGKQGSGLLSSLADANAIIVLPADRDGVASGEAFPAQWIGGCPS